MDARPGHACPGTPELHRVQDVAELFLMTPVPPPPCPPPARSPLEPAAPAAPAASGDPPPHDAPKPTPLLEISAPRQPAGVGGARMALATPVSLKKTQMCATKGVESPWWKDIAFSPICSGKRPSDEGAATVVHGTHGVAGSIAPGALALESPAGPVRLGDERAELVGEALLPALPSPDIGATPVAGDGRVLQLSGSTLESVQRLSAWPVAGPARKVVRQLEFVRGLEGDAAQESDGDAELTFSDDEAPAEGAAIALAPSPPPLEAAEAAAGDEAPSPEAAPEPAPSDHEGVAACGGGAGADGKGPAVGPGGRPLRMRAKTARAAEAEELLELERREAPRPRSPPRPARRPRSSPRRLTPRQETRPALPLVGATAEKKRPPAAPGRRCCNCKKSRCLKLYCECFAAQEYCDGCNCVACLNTPEHARERGEAIEATRERNPHAFKPKIREEGPASGRHCKGCHCRKSNCQKKYCECFQAGVPCSDACKCCDCRNRPAAPRAAPASLEGPVGAAAGGQPTKRPRASSPCGADSVAASSRAPPLDLPPPGGRPLPPAPPLTMTAADRAVAPLQPELHPPPLAA
eukprot:tig00000037_g10089.t1